MTVSDDWYGHAEELAGHALSRLVNRADGYGRYRSLEERETASGNALTVKAPFSLEVAVRHFEGRCKQDLCGLHSTSRDETSRWAALDIDRHGESGDPEANARFAIAVHGRATSLGLQPLLLDSNGRGGFHVWVIFEEPISTEHAFKLLKWLSSDWKDFGLDGAPEPFPKQPKLRGAGYGNWLRLPGLHHTHDHWSRVWDGEQWLEGEPAIEVILAARGVPEALIPPEALEWDPKDHAGKSQPRTEGTNGQIEAKPFDEVSVALEALSYLNGSYLDNYDRWLQVGFALNSLGSPGLVLWDTWSAGNPQKYRPGACQEKWSTMSPGDGIGLGSLVEWAKSEGWSGPRRSPNRRPRKLSRNGQSPPSDDGRDSEESGYVFEPNEAADDPDRLAKVFLEAGHMHEHGPTVRFWREEWLTWSGGYSVIGEGELTAKLARSIKAEFDRLNEVETSEWENRGRTDLDGNACPQPLVRKLSRNLVANVAQSLRSRVLLESSIPQPSWLGGDGPWPPEEVLPARNGLVHLRTLVEGKPDAMLPPTPRFFIGHSLDYDFRVDAPEPVRWFEFLESLWPSDPETIQLLQEWFGLNLTSDTTFQKILMAIGPPRCGKGTIIRVLKGMVGAANVCSPTLGSLATNFGLAPLLSKPTGVIADARLSGRSDLAQVAERLLSISGEDPVTVDRKHLSAITCVLPTRLVIVSNEMPRFSEASGALTNRMLIMQFTRSFLGKEDRTLTASLMRELPGILLWSCEGWRRLMERGHFVQPGSGEELRESLEEMSSPTATFVKEMCVVGVEREVSVSELFEAWKQWCADKGRDHVGDQFRFGRDLKAAVPSVTKVQHRLPGNRRERFYSGIGLTRDLDF